jgi:hypothetical protein
VTNIATKLKLECKFHLQLQFTIDFATSFDAN